MGKAQEHLAASHGVLEEKSRFFSFIFSLPASSCLPGFSPEETDQARALLSSVGEQRVFPVPRQVFPRMKQLLDLYFSQRPFRRALIQSAASELLCAVLAALTPAEPASARNGTLETLKAYIDQNLDVYKRQPPGTSPGQSCPPAPE